MEAFWFSKFHENVAKLGKSNFKRGLTVTFKVKNSLNYRKKWLKIVLIDKQILQAEIKFITNSLTVGHQ